MLLRPEPIFDAYKSLNIPEKGKKVLFFSPKGKKISHKYILDLTKLENIVLICGHYEGVDERAITAIGAEEVSVGDFVLTGGETAACIVTEAVARLLPGVLAEPICHQEESISSGLLEYPQYTRPAVWEGVSVPDILLSGDHEKIRLWRLEESLRLTDERRPELSAAWREAHPPKVKKPRRTKSSPKTEP